MTRTHAHEEEKEIVATITKVLLLTVRMAVGVEGRASEGGGGRNMNDDAIVEEEEEEAPIFPMSKQTLFFSTRTARSKLSPTLLHATWVERNTIQK